MQAKILVAAGLVSEAVYLVASVRLPWTRYGWGLNSWSQLLGGGAGGAAGGVQSGFVACLGGALVLIGAYVAGWRAVRRGAVPRRLVWAGCLLFTATLFWILPITSDLFGYLTQAHQMTDQGANPLVAAAMQDSDDPLFQAYPSVYVDQPSMYGPAWLLLSAVGTLGHHDLVVGTTYLKGVAAVGFLGSAWLMERMLRRIRPRSASEGLYLFAWNPLLLFTAIGDGHNDVVMVAAMLLAITWLDGRRWALACGALALAVWIKYAAVILLPLFALYLWREAGQAGSRERRLALGGAGLSVGLVSAAVLLPFGGVQWIPGLVQRLLSPVNWQQDVEGVSSVLTVVGMAACAVAWAGALVHLGRAAATIENLLDTGFVLLLLVFVLAFARSQPWHLIWAACVAGLSRRGWAWPVVVGLSAVMLLAQVWVEWGAPGLGINT